nr:hypothetical protein [Tanacetum cinerariifolium]
MLAGKTVNPEPGHNQENHQSEDVPTISAPPPALAFFHIPIPEIRYGPFQEIFGHDHLNDFCGNLDGIWFCYGGGFGYHGYVDSFCRDCFLDKSFAVDNYREGVAAIQALQWKSNIEIKKREALQFTANTLKS